MHLLRMKEIIQSLSNTIKEIHFQIGEVFLYYFFFCLVHVLCFSLPIKWNISYFVAITSFKLWKLKLEFPWLSVAFVSSVSQNLQNKIG